MKKGSFCYKINQQIHHYLGSLFPDENAELKFSQIYFLDSDEATARRTKVLNDIDGKLIEIIQVLNFILRNYTFFKKLINLINLLQDCLHKNNQLIAKYKQIGMEIKDNENYQMKIVDKAFGVDIRIYNQPARNQIAGIMPSSSNFSNPREIVIQQKTNRLQKISHLHSSYEPLSYPLFFPDGNGRYSTKLYCLNSNGIQKKITLLSYIVYFLQIRLLSNNILFKGGKLFLQYLVNMFSNVESERLNYIVSKQKDLKATSYKAAYEAYEKAKRCRILVFILEKKTNNTNLKQILKKNEQVNSLYFRRHSLMVSGTLHNCTKISVAILMAKGKPDLFITVTTNPKWKEITKALFKDQIISQEPWERPDLLCRVFDIKLNAILEDIKKKNKISLFSNKLHLKESISVPVTSTQPFRYLIEYYYSLMAHFKIFFFIFYCSIKIVIF